MTLLKIGNRIVNTDTIAEIAVYWPGELPGYEKDPDSYSSNVYRANSVLVARVRTTAPTHTEYANGSNGTEHHVIDFEEDDARALMKWLSSNAADLRPATEEDEAYADYKAVGGDMTREGWERVWRLHNQYQSRDDISPYESQLLL